jgi:aspartyl-tRNA(Asn)/glutamyl-tRNA(Gln) amidotransferase subunit C
MQINEDILTYTCKLARLEIPEEKKSQMLADFQRMLDFVEHLQEVDTEGVEPLIHMTEEVNRLREDVPEPPLDREAALKNAPSRNEAFFRVPKVVRKL